MEFTTAYDDVPDTIEDIGKIFRIGYYSRQDGLDIVWLVNADGKYSETTDQSSIHKNFKILHRSDESDFFGDDRPPLKPLKSSSRYEWDSARKGDRT
ncbi:MAG: hypothetical protein ABI615_12530 [Chthoniobacterales bacterium]